MLAPSMNRLCGVGADVCLFELPLPCAHSTRDPGRPFMLSAVRKTEGDECSLIHISPRQKRTLQQARDHFLLHSSIFRLVDGFVPCLRCPLVRKKRPEIGTNGTTKDMMLAFQSPPASY